MSIQPSIVIWTVICFVLLMLILNNLLFKPVLEVMDKRRAKIEAAKAKKVEHDRLCAEQKRLTEEKRAEHEEAQRKLIKERVETVRQDQRKAVEAAKETRLHQLDDYRKKTEAEEAEILSKLNDHAEELASILADSIVKG